MYTYTHTYKQFIYNYTHLYNYINKNKLENKVWYQEMHLTKNSHRPVDENFRKNVCITLNYININFYTKQ